MLLRTLFRKERFLMRDRKSLEVQVRSLRSSVSFWGPDESSNEAVEVQAKTVASPKISVDISPSPFDTHLMINQLQQLGFTQVQSEGLVTILAKLGSEQKGQLHSKDLDLLDLKFKAQIEAIKHSQALLEKGSIAQLKDTSSELRAEIGKLKDSLHEEVTKVNSGVQLDINLERGRSKDNEIMIDQKIKDTNNRIDSEVALLKIAMESNKLDTVKYVSGIIMAIVTVVLSVVMGIWRLTK